MAKLRQSVCAGCFLREGFAPDRLLREAKRIGFEAIESIGEEHWAEVKRQGFTIPILCGHWPLDKGCAHAEDHAEVGQAVRGSMEKARAFGIANVLIFSGNRRGQSDEDGIRHSVAFFKQLAGEAERNGVTLCMELLNSVVDHPDYQCDHTAWGLEVVKRVGSPRVKLLYDIYHMQIMEGDLIRKLTGALDWVAHIHTAGNPGRHEIGDDQEIHYPGLMKALARAGYRGFVGHEFFPVGDPVAALEEAWRACSVG